jgi:hypothetical protein
VDTQNAQNRIDTQEARSTQLQIAIHLIEKLEATCTMSGSCNA